MSMLSSQADELRLMARLVRDYDYKEISRMLREAADTIISLRDRLQDAELGRGACVPHGEWESLTQTTEFRRMYCDCGYELGMDSRNSFPLARTTYAAMPRFCPECGARIVSKGEAVE